MAKTNKTKYKNNISTNHNVQGTGSAFEDFFLEQAVAPGTRFFYFVSLGQEYNGPNAKQYATRAMRALSSAYQDTTIEMQQQDYMQILRDILQVIEGFQKYEANNEYTVFQQQLQPLIDVSPYLYDEFSNTFKDGKIDYIRFMALLKILNQDINVVKHELSNLHAHMKEFDKAYDQALKDAVAEKKKHNEKNEPIDEYTFNLQTRADQVDAARAALENKTSEIEEFLASGVQRIRMIQSKSGQNKLDMNRLSKIVRQMLRLGKSTYGYKDIVEEMASANEDHILYELIGVLQRQARAYEIDFSKYLKGVEDTLSLVELGGEATKKHGKGYLSPYDQGDILVKTLVNCLKHADIIDQEYAGVEKILNGDKKITKSKMNWGAEYAGLTKRRREAILQALHKIRGVDVNALTNLEELEKTTNAERKEDRFDIRRKADFDKYINLIRQALGKTERFSLKSIIAILEDYIKTSEAATRKQLITLSSESGSALDLTKILQTGVIKMGQDNFREDSIHIGVATYTFEETNTQNVEGQIDDEMKKISNMQQDLLNIRRSTVYKDIKKDNTRNKRQAQEYDVTGTLRASQHGDEVIAKEISKKLNIQDIEKIRDLLSHIFIIEDSDKFATTFNQAEFGFKGGSLGADLESQVTNINNMLSLGGITPMDANFLINAIMNAGPGMLGYDQKDRLETYLTSIAAICMFSSGAQSLQDYAESVKQAVEQTDISSMSTKKIHIFNVGTLYVPLSYILHLIYIGLEKCVNTLETAALGGSAGAKVTIFNPVNEATDKVSKKYISPHHGREYYIGDWYATAEQGLPKVTLNMAILGSYLDVLEDINKILAKVFY